MMIRKLASGNRRLCLQNLDEMANLAHFLSKLFSSSEFVALTGNLGTGKTTFTQFLCYESGYTDKIHSPSFTLLNEYPRPQGRILHGDLYRLSTSEIEQDEAFFESAFEQPETLILMEWADKAPQFEYRWTWHLHFEYHPQDENARIVAISTERLECWPEFLSQYPYEGH